MVFGDEISKTFEESFLKNLRKHDTPNGILICNQCRGYYKLNIDESPEDFEECECNGNLEYYRNIDEYINRESENSDYGAKDINTIPQDFNELHEIMNDLKNRAERRKELFEDLSKSISVQEKLLEKIKEDKWSLWDSVEGKNLKRDIEEQKGMVKSIIEQEDKLLTYIDKQRDLVKNSRLDNDQIFFWRTGVFMAVIVIIILILYLYLK